jgi:hypothetical protein
MLLYCITAPVTPQVMDRLALKNHIFALQVRGKSVQDGRCSLIVIMPAQDKQPLKSEKNWPAFPPTCKPLPEVMWHSSVNTQES